MTQKCDQGRPTRHRPTHDSSASLPLPRCEPQIPSCAAVTGSKAAPLAPEGSSIGGIVWMPVDGSTLSDTDHQARIAAICDGVTDIVAALFNVSGRDLRSPGRSVLAVSRVRQIAMYVTHVTLRLSMRDVGLGFGRDRTTVLYACHQVEDLREEEEFDDIVARVERVMSVTFGICSGEG